MTKQAAKKEAKIRHRDFAQRMEQACDSNPQVPALHYGRLGWIADQLEARFGKKVSQETIRKWFVGETKPKPIDVTRLAELFRVDEAWLAIGRTPDMSLSEQKARNATVEGIVNVVAGVIRMGGGHPAFPKEGDDSADLYAIIKGAQYSLRVCLATHDDGQYKFFVPPKSDHNLVIGAIAHPGHRFEFVEIDDDTIASGTNRGGFCEVVVQPGQLREIKTFEERI